MVTATTASASPDTSALVGVRGVAGISRGVARLFALVFLVLAIVSLLL